MEFSAFEKLGKVQKVKDHAASDRLPCAFCPNCTCRVRAGTSSHTVTLHYTILFILQIFNVHHILITSTNICQFGTKSGINLEVATQVLLS